MKQLIVKTNLGFDSSEKDTFIAEGKDQFLTDCCIAALRKIHSQYNHQSNPLISPETLKFFFSCFSIVMILAGITGIIIFQIVAANTKEPMYLIGLPVSIIVIILGLILLERWL